MDLETITTILAVANTKSFGSAAYMIPCSQSSVSRKVMSAETELGTKLFIRPTESADKLLRLTDAGKQIIPILETIVENYRELFAVASNFSAKKSSMVVLRLGIMAGSMLPFMFSYMKASLYDLNPNINLNIEFGPFEYLMARLKSRLLDAVLFPCLSIDPENLPYAEQFSLRELGSSCFSIGISRSDPLLKQKPVRPQDLQDMYFFMGTDTPAQIPGITFYSSDIFRKVFQRECGFDPKIRPLSGQMAEISHQFALNAKGVFTTHLPHRWRDINGVEFLDYPSLNALRQTYFLFHPKRNNSKELDYFCSFFSEALHNQENASEEDSM